MGNSPSQQNSVDVTSYEPANTNYLDRNTLLQKLNNYQQNGTYAPSGNYVTVDQLKDYQQSGNYAPSAQYALQTEVQQKYLPKGNYALIADLNNYAPAGNYATKDELNKLQPAGDYLPAGDYALYDQKQYYATSNTFINDVKEIDTRILAATDDDITKYFINNINQYARQNELINYQPIGNYAPGPSSLYTITDSLPGQQQQIETTYQKNGKYVTTDQLNSLKQNLVLQNDFMNNYQVKGNYVTPDQFNHVGTSDALKNFAKVSDMSGYQPVGNYAVIAPSGSYVDDVMISSYVTTDYMNTIVNNNGTIVGPQGADGPIGATGSPGANGATGPQGPTGPPGDQGPPGTDGTDGIDGKDGIQGITGVDGVNGKDSTIPGLSGDNVDYSMYNNVIIKNSNAMVKDGNSLVFNYKNDFTGGTVINGTVNNIGKQVNISGKLCIQNTCITEDQLAKALHSIPPVHCIGQWTNSGKCTTTGTAKTQAQIYKITTPAAYGGSACPYNDGDTQNIPC